MMGAASTGQTHHLAHAFGQVMMNDSVDPEHGGAQHVRSYIPREDAVDDYHLADGQLV